MPHSLKYLMSKEAAVLRFKDRKPNFVVHLETNPYTDEPMTELCATDLIHANNIARDWLLNGRAVSAGVRKANPNGSLEKDVTVLDASDFEDDLAEQTQQNLNRTMSKYGLVG